MKKQNKKVQNNMEDKKSRESGDLHDKKLKKAGITALSVSVLMAGTAGMVYAYQNSKDYKPSKDERDLKDNQVVFSKNENLFGQKDQKKDDSELLKKKDKGKDADTKPKSNYLFENGSAVFSGNRTSVNLKSGQGVSGGANSNNDSTYKLTDDPSNADVFVNPGNGDANGNGNGNGSGNNNGGSNGNNNGGSNGNNNGGSDNNGGGGSDNPSNGGDDTPTVRPSSTVSDPDTEKTTPSDPYFVYKPYTDDVQPSSDPDEDGNSDSVVVLPSTDADAPMLYKGQKASKKTIYNVLSTYVIGKDGTIYLWGSEQFETYIRISGVSFNGGETWETTFPVTIPMDVKSGQMKIRTEYRLSKSSKKWVKRDVDYDPKDTRVFVLSREVKKGESNIASSTILNKGNQYPDVGTNLNLYGVVQNYLSATEPLSALFPGWTENGKEVPWFYPVKIGRHILEPMAMQPLDPCYTVELQNVWMTEDYHVDASDNDAKLCYLQTFTNVDGPWKSSWADGNWQIQNMIHTLTIPKYVQAINVDKDAGLSVDNLKIPDTVLYIDFKNNGMRVNNGYTVDAANPCYAATRSGILTNKTETEYLSIPYNIVGINISEKITKVSIEKKNKLKKITLQQKDKEKLPKIDYDKLSNCEVVVDDELVQSILEEHTSSFTNENGNRLVAASHPDIGYYVEDGMIVSTEGELIEVLPPGNKRVKLPDHIRYVQPDAFTKAGNTTSLVLSPKGTVVKFEKGCLESSAVKTILCYETSQYNYMVSQLKEEGVTGITVELLQKSREGYGYSIENEGGKEICTLIDAPDEVVQFTGKVTAKDGSDVKVTEIGDSAFVGCKQLKWVILPENVKVIGNQAFLNCNQLQGVLIRNQNRIVIGNQAFENCDSLRFLASNAQKCELLAGYAPEITDSKKNNFFFAPTGSTGYGSTATSFVSNSGVASYDVVSDGGDGWILYGLDSDKEPWLVLRSGGTLPTKVSMSETSLEIFNGAFADTQAEDGEAYSVDFRNTDIQYIDSTAFYKSSLGRNVVLNKDSMLGESAFAESKEIKTMDLPGTGSLQLALGVFEGCENLQTVTFGQMNEAGLRMGLMNGCDKLTDIYFENKTPIELVLNGNVPFRFNCDWDSGEESQKLKLHVPDGTEESYIKAWRFILSGYGNNADSPAYEQMWNDVFSNNIDWDNWVWPEDAVVDAKLKEQLLEHENDLRKMLGVASVTEPVDFYPYHLETYTGMLRLVGAPSYITTVDLGDTSKFEFLTGWYLDGIETGAFSGSKKLQNVIIPSTLSEIAYDAFKGVESGSLTLKFEGDTPSSLVLKEEGTAFTFGVDDASLHIRVPAGSEDAYIQAWSYKLAGYNDLNDLRAVVREELSASGSTPTDAQVDAAVAKRLLPQVNRLRTMMGLAKVDKLDMEQFGLKTEEEKTKEKDKKSVNVENPENQDTEKKDSKEQDPGKKDLKEQDPENRQDPDSKGEESDKKTEDESSSEQAEDQKAQQDESSKNDTKTAPQTAITTKQIREKEIQE